MHILETYALLSGAKIGQCFIEEEKIDLPQSHYITFHPYSPKGNSKQYIHWDIIISMFKQNSIFSHQIIQIGEKNDQKYDVDTSYLGKTSYGQLSYLIKNTDLHLGFDSLPIHIASHYNKKIVGIYSYYASTCGPYFSDPNYIRIFEPDFTEIKPSYSYDDPFGLINSIKPDKIYNAVIELLYT